LNYLSARKKRYKRIVFFLNTPLTKRDYFRFGIDIVKENYDILFVDFTKFFYPLVKKDTYIKKDNIDCDYLTVKTRNEIISSFNQLNQQDQIVLLFHYNQKTFPIFIELSKKKLNYSIFMQNSVPLPKKSGKRNNYYNKIFDKKILSKMKNRIFNNIKLSKKLFNLKSPNYLLLGGKQSKNNYSDYNLKGNTTNELYLHTLDYNDYLYIKNLPTGKIEKYVVFLEQPGPLFVADALTLNQKESILTEEKYFPSINKFLDFIELKTNSTVIIAGHPDSKHESISPHYGNRRVIYGKVGKLIKDCEFIITKGSTAISFAVLFSKPIIFYTTSEYQNNNITKKAILAYSDHFNKTPINIDADYIHMNIDKELVVDDKLYSLYEENYIKTKKSINQNSWEIFINELKQI